MSTEGQNRYCTDGSPNSTGFFPSLKLTETNSKFAPENGWLEDEVPFGKPNFRGRTVRFREGNSCYFPSGLKFLHA